MSARFTSTSLIEPSTSNLSLISFGVASNGMSSVYSPSYERTIDPTSVESPCITCEISALLDSSKGKDPTGSINVTINFHGSTSSPLPVTVEESTRTLTPDNAFNSVSMRDAASLASSRLAKLHEMGFVFDPDMNDRSNDESKLVTSIIWTSYTNGLSDDIVMV